MMGSAPPSQSMLSDLSAFLDVLQAASDPKKAKAFLGEIEQARKQYDDAIAEAQARIAAASEAEKKAEVAASKAEAAEAKLEKKRSDLDARAAVLKSDAESLENDRQILATLRAEVEAQAKTLVVEREQMNASASMQLKMIADNRTAFEQETAAFDVKAKALDDLRAEYTAKMAKLKEIAA